MDNIRFDTTDKLTMIAGAAYTSGTPVLIGNALGVPISSVASGAKVAMVFRGRVKLDKTTAEAWVQGDELFWVAGTSKLTTTVGSNKAVGQAGVAAGASDTEGWIDLALGNADNAGVTTALTAAAVSAGAGIVPVSAGNDRTTEDSEMSIEAADGASQGASPVFANTSDAFTFKILTPDAPGADIVLIADEIVAGKFVQVTFVGGSATAASAADPDLAGGQVLSCVPVSTSDQALQSAELQGDGSVIVTTMVAQTGAAEYNLIVERG